MQQIICNLCGSPFERTSKRRLATPASATARAGSEAANELTLKLDHSVGAPVRRCSSYVAGLGGGEVLTGGGIAASPGQISLNAR
jgi:hypothetical protein